MFSLPRKRRVDIEDNGTSDEDEWHVGYAEDIDEQRAELLRRLDSKAAGPTKLVNPWVTPIGPSPDDIPHGALALDVSVHHLQHPGGEDGRGLSRLMADGCYGDFAATNGDAGKSSCGDCYDEDVVSPAGLGDLMGRQQQQQQQSTSELLRRDLQDQQPWSAVGTAAGGVLAATQGLKCGPSGSSDHSAGGAGPSALQNGRNATTATTMTPVAAASGHGGDGPTDCRSIGHGGVGVGVSVGGEGGHTVVTTVASPYAALLVTPGGGGVERRGCGGGQLGSVAPGRTLPSPRAPRLGPNWSSSSRGAQRTSRGGLGGLVSLPHPGSSQKSKKAKFVIRESPNPSPATATGHQPQPRHPLPHHHQHHQHQHHQHHHHHHYHHHQHKQHEMTDGMSQGNMALAGTAGGNEGSGGDVATEATRRAGPSAAIHQPHEGISAGGLAVQPYWVVDLRLHRQAPPPRPPSAAHQSAATCSGSSFPRR
ncbi:hypothetical protein VaNZ11_010834 [Volvox africanus]|uniref:Uncharacterized protein n=1 Tax=Volvox africanus TaxID=51714 RepID=A0ABQ5SAF1_9CHLO|nr:hypothetical protein VaNZ11_010834 [Volvox africanus]